MYQQESTKHFFETECTRFPIWLQVSVLFSLATMVRLSNLDHGVVVDELYHVLAARSWIADGTLAISDGVYERTPGFTKLVAAFFAFFGESLAVGRLPSVFAGALWVVGIFLWTRSVAGALAAWVAALWFCLSYDSIRLSQLIRFYALHGLFFWIASIGVYELLTRNFSRTATAALVTSAALFWYLALYLQSTTLIGAAGVGLWALVRTGGKWSPEKFWSGWRDWKFRAGIIPALIFVAVVIVTQTNIVDNLLKSYRTVAVWKIDDANDYLYYHKKFFQRHTIFWIFLPIAAWIAVIRKPVAGGFCVSVLTVSVVLHSFAGMKHVRYIYYAMPFFFVLWSIVLTESVPFLWRMAEKFTKALFKDTTKKRLGPRTRAIYAGMFLFLFAIFNPSVVISLVGLAPGSSAESLITRLQIEKTQDSPLGWEKAVSTLRPISQEASVVITTNVLFSLYYLGRCDYDVSPNRLFETADGEDFSHDPRTGTMVISTAESLKMILSCYPSGLFVSDLKRWRHPLIGITDEAADALISLSEPIQLPGDWNLVVFSWNRSQTVTDPKCASLREIIAKPSNPVFEAKENAENSSN